MKAQTKHFKKGMIILWYGAIADIPGGWQLCDGTNSSPNLKNVFVVGAGDTYNPDATGGADAHSHTGEPVHIHTLNVGGDIAAGAAFSDGTGSPSKGGATGSTNVLPPYHALAYIMKL